MTKEPFGPLKRNEIYVPYTSFLSPMISHFNLGCISQVFDSVYSVLFGFRLLFSAANFFGVGLFVFFLLWLLRLFQLFLSLVVLGQILLGFVG